MQHVMQNNVHAIKDKKNIFAERKKQSLQANKHVKFKQAMP